MADIQEGGAAEVQAIHRTSKVTTKDNPQTNMESR
jgi:hypothetical protein